MLICLKAPTLDVIHVVKEEILQSTVPMSKPEMSLQLLDDFITVPMMWTMNIIVRVTDPLISIHTHSDCMLTNQLHST